MSGGLRGLGTVSEMGAGPVLVRVWGMGRRGFVRVGVICRGKLVSDVRVEMWVCQVGALGCPSRSYLWGEVGFGGPSGMRRVRRSWFRRQEVEFWTCVGWVSRAGSGFLCVEKCVSRAGSGFLCVEKCVSRAGSGFLCVEKCVSRA